MFGVSFRDEIATAIGLRFFMMATVVVVATVIVVVVVG